MQSLPTSSRNTKYKTEIGNTIQLSTICDMELNTVHNTENIAELNTVHNMILNNTSIEYENSTQYIQLKKYTFIQELYRKERQRIFVMQAVVHSILLTIILLIVIIVCIKHNYIK